MLPEPLEIPAKNLNSPVEILEKTSEFLTSNPTGIIEILGPTASGKTGYSIYLAKWIEGNFAEKCEIISVDSRQVFRDMDISSAKITEEEKQGIPHHGLDLCSPDEEFNVVAFQKYAFEKIVEIQTRGNRVILCGGTMLWLDAISENYIFTEEKGDKSMEKGEPKWPVFKIGMYWKRSQLYRRTDLRSEILFDNGLIAETREILKKYPNITKSALTSFGYLEIRDYLNGKTDLKATLKKNQQKNRKYAKRQLTWWRGRKDVNWVKAKDL
jgi:tRNA dimethylallyltransferase